MHQPVLLNEVIDLLQVREGGAYVDGTAGCGGHTAALLERAGPNGRVLAIDRDPASVERLRSSFSRAESRCMVAHGNFAGMRSIAHRNGIERVDGIVLDLGVSSEQLDNPGRGFSFMADGPLDMRMDPSSGQNAAEMLGRLSEGEIARVLREFGEEPRARRMARAIIAALAKNPIETTCQLAGIAESVYGGRRGRTHPATRVFQALRILVNRELASLSAGLEAGIELLRPGGRIAVIAFHSLEDRIVKRCFAEHAGRWESLPEGGRKWIGKQPEIERITRKPVRPGESELSRNPRARSARLRVAERKAGNGKKE